MFLFNTTCEHLSAGWKMYVNPEANVVTCKLSRRCLDLGVECVLSPYLRGNYYNPPPSLSCGAVEAELLSPHPPSLYPSISHSQQPWMLQIIALHFYCSLTGGAELCSFPTQVLWDAAEGQSEMSAALPLRSFYRLQLGQKSEDSSRFEMFLLPCFACSLPLATVIDSQYCFFPPSFICSSLSGVFLLPASL